MRRNYQLVLLLLTPAAGVAAMAGWAVIADRGAPIPPAQGDQAAPPADLGPPDHHPFLALERVQDDPLAPDYHPVGRPGARMRRLRAMFEAEPRDPVWAAAREARLLAQVAQALKPFAGARVNFADCRTFSCRYEVAIPIRDVQRYLKQRLPVGGDEATSLVHGIDGLTVVTVYSSIKPRSRPDHAYSDRPERKGRGAARAARD